MRGRVAWVVVGLAALGAGTLAGWNGRLLETLAGPPALVRAALVAVMILAAVRLLAEAIVRIEAARHTPPDAMGAHDLAVMIRGVRYVFLTVAALAAAGGWLLGSPVPLVAALLIAGVDVVETSFLLLVVTVRGDHSAS